MSTPDIRKQLFVNGVKIERTTPENVHLHQKPPEQAKAELNAPKHEYNAQERTLTGTYPVTTAPDGQPGVEIPGVGVANVPPPHQPLSALVDTDRVLVLERANESTVKANTYKLGLEMKEGDNNFHGNALPPASGKLELFGQQVDVSGLKPGETQRVERKIDNGNRLLIDIQLNPAGLLHVAGAFKPPAGQELFNGLLTVAGVAAPVIAAATGQAWLLAVVPSIRTGMALAQGDLVGALKGGVSLAGQLLPGGAGALFRMVDQGSRLGEGAYKLARGEMDGFYQVGGAVLNLTGAGANLANGLAADPALAQFARGASSAGNILSGLDVLDKGGSGMALFGAAAGSLANTAVTQYQAHQGRQGPSTLTGAKGGGTLVGGQGDDIIQMTVYGGDGPGRGDRTMFLEGHPGDTRNLDPQQAARVLAEAYKISPEQVRELGFLEGQPLEVFAREDGSYLDVHIPEAAHARMEQLAAGQGSADPNVSELAPAAGRGLRGEFNHAPLNPSNATRAYANLTADNFAGPDDIRLNQINRVVGQANTEFVNNVRGLMESNGIDAHVYGRAKTPESIFGKLRETPGMQISDIRDYSGARIDINPTQPNFAEYHQAANLVQEQSPGLELKKDYIAHPNIAADGSTRYTGRMHYLLPDEARGFTHEVQFGSTDVSALIDTRLTTAGGDRVSVHDATGYKGQLYGTALPDELQGEYYNLMRDISQVNGEGNTVSQVPEMRARVERFFNDATSSLPERLNKIPEPELSMRAQIGNGLSRGMGAVGVIGGSLQVADGVNDLQNGRPVEGVMDTTLGVGNVLANGATVLGRVGLGTTAGGVVAVGEGARDMYVGVRDGDPERAGVGGAKTAAGGAMLLGAATSNPVLIVGGAAVYLGATIHDNRENIGRIVNTAGTWMMDQLDGK